MHQDFTELAKQMERVAKKGLKGIKMHHHDFQIAYADDSRFFRTIKKLKKWNICLLHER